MTSKPPFETVVAQHGATVLRVCRALLGPADAWSETFLSSMRAYPDRADVLHRLPDIGYGHAAVAALAGTPKAVRAVDTACATNPLPVVIPCHRVVRSDGSMGGYLGCTWSLRL